MDYSELCSIYEQLEKTTKRLEKTQVLSAFLKDVGQGELEAVLLLVQGLVYPAWDERKLGFSSSYVMKALSLASGVSVDEIKELWRETGDLGTCAQLLADKKKQTTLFTQKLTVEKVFSNLRSLAAVGGEGSVDAKVGLVAELLSCATATEAKFIVRAVLDETRVGLGEGTLRDALVWAFLPGVLGISAPFEKGQALPSGTTVLDVLDEVEKKDFGGCHFVFSEDESVARGAYALFVEKVQRALDICNDFGKVARALKKHGLTGLGSISLVPGTPLKVMLALKEENVAAAFERVGKPAAIEHKLDGFRMQIHKDDGNVRIFTRRLENVTTQFPDVVRAVAAHVEGVSFIIDCEAVGVDKVSGKLLPFQNISQRIKRKYDIAPMAKDFPVETHIFDILYHDGHALLEIPFQERRALLERIVRVGGGVRLTEQIQTADEHEAEQFYQRSLALGNEGVMFKSVEAPYQPGARVGNMVKLKTTMETLDVVIVGAEWGEGKRSAWLSSYVVACRDEGNGELKVVGRVSTGLKEKKEEGLSFADLTEALQPLVVAHKGREVTVTPQVVIEVSYEEIQTSPGYSSGFALRFPRVVRLREDRDAASCSTLADVRRLFESQG